MRLSRREVEVLDCLFEKQLTAKGLAAVLGVKLPNLSKILKKLRRYKLVAVSKAARGNVISLDYAVWFTFIEVKRSFPGIKLRDVLVGYAPFLLSFMKTKEKFTVKDIDLPVATTKRLLKKLRSIGFVFMPKKGTYALRREASVVADFCRQKLIRFYADLAVEELRGIQQLCFSFNSAKGLEAVFVTGKPVESKNYFLTAYSVFHEFGVQLISSGKYYYSNKKPTIADVVVHALATGKDERAIAFAAALMVKNKFNHSKLLGKQQKFDLSEEFLRNLVEFVQTKGERTFDNFPYWSEVEGVTHG